jgi:hypothetical protein
MNELLYHYYDDSTGPFLSLSDLEVEEAERVFRYQDGKPYRNQVYTLNEIRKVVNEFGLPQEWNFDGNKGPERYIEVQVWDDKSLCNWQNTIQFQQNIHIELKK